MRAVLPQPHPRPSGGRSLRRRREFPFSGNLSKAYVIRGMRCAMQGMPTFEAVEALAAGWEEGQKLFWSAAAGRLRMVHCIGRPSYFFTVNRPGAVFLNRASFPFRMSRRIAAYKVAAGVLPPGDRQ